MNKKGKMRLASNINFCADIDRKEKSISIYSLAFAAGYSAEYFKRAVLPLIIEMNECVRLDGRNLIWICEEEANES